MSDIYNNLCNGVTQLSIFSKSVHLNEAAGPTHPFIDRYATLLYKQRQCRSQSAAAHFFSVFYYFFFRLFPLSL